MWCRQPTMTIYLPTHRLLSYGGRLFVRTAGDPYALVPAVTRIVRELAPDQPVERAATLADVRATVLSPDRVNAFVFSGFAGMALLIAVVGVASVLAFSVSARTREFGVRLAVGAAPRQLLARVLSEGVVIATIGIAAGAVGRLRAGARRWKIARAGAAAGCPTCRRCDGGAPCRCGARFVDARRASLARGRLASAAIGVNSRLLRKPGI